MADLAARLALKARLPRTWPAFFERHGNFTFAQIAAIPAVLDGRNIMLCAATASGKTEAVLAPLIERYCAPSGSRHAPTLLYITPTRALVNDLRARLTHQLAALRLTLGVKTGDTSSFRPTRPPDLLLTTPESVDSLLTTHPRLFARIQAVVIDELHLFHGTPRGDHLRVLLERIRQIRHYASEHGDTPNASIQYAALSATLTQPETVAALYFPDADVIQTFDRRVLEAEQIGMGRHSTDELRAFLHTFRARGWRKALVFCNSRAEVEAYAAVVRADSPFGDAVYVHYSNIESRRRREIERRFAEADAALCFTSTTLELGIDIGTIDVVLLIGPPGSVESFTQRIGRGNRRQRVTRVACFARTPLERLMFDALTTAHAEPSLDSRLPAPKPFFRPAVAIQQIFSLIRQSPTGGVRLSDLATLFAGLLSVTDLESILSELRLRDYLVIGRPGEWRAGPRLNKLVDEQASAQPGLSLYSNVQTSDARLIAVRDQQTHEIVARVDAQWFDRPTLTLEGRPVNIEWYDGDALWITSQPNQDAADQFRYRSARQLVSYDLARLVPARLGLAPDSAPFVAAETPTNGWYWFHWLGDLYGRAALDLLRYQVAATASSAPGLCVHLPDELRAPPVWSETQVTRYLEDSYRQFEPLLNLGPFHHLLPVPLRRRAVVEQFDVPRFLAAVSMLRPVVAPESLAADLLMLLHEG